MAVAVATLVAFVIAFFLTCTILPGGDSVLLTSFLAGLGAAGVVVAFAIWLASRFRSGRE